MSFISGIESIQRDQRRRGLSAFLEFSNVHIIVVALGLTAGTFTLLASPVNKAYLAVACCGAFLIYQMDRVWMVGEEDLVNQPLRVAWINTHRPYVLLTLSLSCGVALVASFQLPAIVLLAGFGLGMLGLLYLSPVLPGQRRLKSIWYVKPLAIAAAWATGCVFLPALTNPTSSTVETAPILALFFYRFLFVLPNVLLADWLDREGDSRAGIRSLALMVSETQLRSIAAGSAVLAIGVGIWIGSNMHWQPTLYVDLIGPILMLGICVKGMMQTRIYSVVLLDLIVAWPLVTFFVAGNI